MTGPMACDCTGTSFRVFIERATMVLECTSCGFRAACRIAGPVIANAS